MATSNGTRRQKTAIVVGAGLSGLACARELVHSNWNVIIVEARDRIGGRVFTEHFLNGAPVDVGASFIHGIEDNPVAELALREGANLHERLTCPLFDADGSPLNPETDQTVEDEFNSTLERAAKRKHNRSVPEDESLEEALEASLTKRKFSARDQRAFNWHLSNLEYSVNADLSQVKSDGWDADDPFGLEGAHCVVSGQRGMSVVADRLAKGLDKQTIYLSHVVKRIIYHATGVKVEAIRKKPNGMNGGPNENGLKRERIRREAKEKSERNASSLAEDEELVTFVADCCIVTASLGVLKARSMTFVPDLPKPKRAAIDNMGFGLLNKIALLFPFKFWGDDCEIFGYCSEQRGDMPIFVDLSQDGYPILCILISGTPAEKLESDAFFHESNGNGTNQNDSALVNRCCQILKKIFRHVPPVLEAKVTRWKTDAFAHGSYSFIACPSRPEDYDILAAPVSSARHGVPRLFFAGEATNRFFPASVHGAFFSGIREAQRVNKWLGKVSSSSSSSSSSSTGVPSSCPMGDEERLCVMTVSSRAVDRMTQEKFKEMYAPDFTFEQHEILDNNNNHHPSSSVNNHHHSQKGKIFLSKASAGPSGTTASNGGLPASPRAGGKKGRSRNPMGSSGAGKMVVFPLAKRPKLSLESLQPGDRLEVAWKNGKYFSGWISTLDRQSNGQVSAGIYYDADGSFERLDLSTEKWRPLPPI